MCLFLSSPFPSSITLLPPSLHTTILIPLNLRLPYSPTSPSLLSLYSYQLLTVVHLQLCRVRSLPRRGAFPGGQ